MKKLILCFLLVSRFAYAQDTLKFDKALVVASGSKYGREAIYKDPVLWQLSQGVFKKPELNAEFGIGERGEKVLWKELKADQNGRFSVFSRNFQDNSNPFLRPGSVDRGSDYSYLTYHSATERYAILNVLGGNSLFFNGAPHMGDPYAAGYMNIPVKLKKGLNEILLRGANFIPRLILVEKGIQVHADDLTIPSVKLEHPQRLYKAAITLSNISELDAQSLSIESRLAGVSKTVGIATIPALSMRKVIFEIDAKSISGVGTFPIEIFVKKSGKIMAQTKIEIEAVQGNTSYKQTFISEIDGSLQYFAVTPQIGGSKNHSALFLSVHGAGVEAIGQAKAYKPKDWGNVVAATNRRPRGFNWEDWGRLDALEVLGLAKAQFKPNPQQIYLTGHSMGGHGTWFLGATYPDLWAAIGPAAGYASLKDYGSADGKIPDTSSIPAERLLLRSGNQSDVPKLASNYQQLGVYILHGDADRVVPVTYARQMKSLLSSFHPDYSYYEYPGGEHWFGDQSVDWPYLFDYFKWHTIKADTLVNQIDFKTSSPGISARYRWATIEQQEHPLVYSRVVLDRNLKTGTIKGRTENVHVLKLDLTDFGSAKPIAIHLDSLRSITFQPTPAKKIIYLRKKDGLWAVLEAPNPAEKNPQRSGTFKEAFNHQMVFVVGTKGDAGINMAKAKFDAESWYYRGNGAVDLVKDTDFNPKQYAGRNIILYGNADQNSAWKTLLSSAPIQVKNNQVKFGDQIFKGDDLAVYFVWPQKDARLLVGVVASTGQAGATVSFPNQYFAGGSGFPDFMISSSQLASEGSKGIKVAGFFDNQWRITSQEMVEQ